MGAFIRRRLVNNPIFVEHYNKLVASENMDSDSIKWVQFELLKKTCIHAYEHTKFYHDEFISVGFDPYKLTSFEEFCEKVPIITKEQVIQRFDEINADDITDYYPATTGGSSGTRLLVNNARETLFLENATHYHYMAQYGYDYKKHKILLLAGEESSGLCSISPLYNMIRVSGRHMNRTNFKEALKFINDEKPDFIIALPSSAYQFCKFLKTGNYKIDSNIQHVFFRSENINPQQRLFIEDVLNCKSTAYYGSTERIVWGEEYEDIEGVPIYTFNPYYGYVEIDNEDGISLVGTGFINPKMPLIRYKTDDIISRVKEGKYTVEGHRSSVMIGKNDESISVEYFCHLEDTFDRIEKYQFEQYEKGKAIVKIVPRYNLKKEEITMIENMFNKMAAYNIVFTAIPVDHVELTPRGKFKLLWKALD